MDILLNGTPRQVPDDIKVSNLLEILTLSGKRVALEVNEAIVPRGQYHQHTLRPGDRVELVHAIGGG